MALMIWVLFSCKMAMHCWKNRLTFDILMNIHFWGESDK